MLFQTTQAHEELRAKVRAFAEEEIKPIAFMLDQQNEFPDEAIRKLGEMGLMGIPFPAEYGGAGLDALSYAIAVEELARVDGGAGVILSAHVSLGSWPIFAYGTEEQKRKYLVPLAKGEKIGAFGLTEPNAGSDAGGTETTAVLKGDHYVLNGGHLCGLCRHHTGYRHPGHQRLHRGEGLEGLLLRRPLRQNGHPLLLHCRADL